MVKDLLVIFLLLVSFGVSGQSSDVRGISRAKSISNAENTELYIYPNPSLSVFQIKNDEGLHTLSIHNIVGKEIMKFKHDLGAQYNIENLHSGIYIVRLYDDQGQLMKVLRLNKK